MRPFGQGADDPFALLRHLGPARLHHVAVEEVAGEAQAIDHLYWASEASGSPVPGTFRVVRDDPGSGLARSDHAAVQADFELPHG